MKMRTQGGKWFITIGNETAEFDNVNDVLAYIHKKDGENDVQN